ncbi:MAG: glycosyltransferase family 1 protein [Lapillicoccus sp.]
MRVLVDATALPPNRGGVARYVDELVSRLPDLGLAVDVACQRRDESFYGRIVGAGRVHALGGWATRPETRMAWEQTGLPLLVRRIRPDVVHSPHYTLPLAAPLATRGGPGCARVVTLHDATFFSHPELHLGVKGAFFRRWTALSARLADGLIVPSLATAREVVAYTGASADKLDIAPHGVDHDRFAPPQPADVAAASEWLGLPLGGEFVAFLGTLEPRKNVSALVRAYVLVCAGMPDPPTLVLAGGKGWDDTIDAAVAEVPADLQVMRPGFVPDGLLKGLLGGAVVVAYPAFGEGFGLPVLEAMACGAAVLTTPLLSLPEVGGDAVAYARTPEVGDVAEALAALLADPVRRRDLGRRAVRRAADFTWDRSARQHRTAYERAANRRAATRKSGPDGRR